jgi:hypothetical protein
MHCCDGSYFSLLHDFFLLSRRGSDGEPLVAAVSGEEDLRLEDWARFWGQWLECFLIRELLFIRLLYVMVCGIV